MKIKEIREKDTSHIEHELVDARKHLFTLRTQAVTEKLEDPTQIGKTRRTIARLKTILRQRAIEATVKAPEKAAK
jgi:large subunit ribosomal protein L29